MAPVQPSLEIDPDCKQYSPAKAAVNMANRSLLAKSYGKVLNCMSNSQESIIEVEDKSDGQIKEAESADDIMVAEAEDPDATECSSSFDGTVSGRENCCGLSDAEVESGFCGDNSLAFDDFTMFPMRKKKLTAHWRSFIRPLMWRCKLTELKIKEFQSRASKYARELAAYDQKKQLELDQLTLENYGSKSLPFTLQSGGKKAMKRRRRNRVEDTTDTTSYMSQHHLFSYHENKRSDPDANLVADNFGNPEQKATSHDEFGITDDCSFHEPKDGNDSLEEIFRKIEIVHSRVHKLKSRLVTVIAENSMKLSSSENLSLLVPCDVQTSSACSPTLSACNGDATSLGVLCAPTQHMSEYDIEDIVMPESVISSYVEAFSVPDIIESTVSLLSSVDVTVHQPQIGDSCEAIMDNVQIHNQAAEVESHTFKMIGDEPMEKHQEPDGSVQGESSDPVPPLEPDHPVAKAATHQDQSGLASCLASEIHFPKSKRKRGERKAGSGVWNR